MSTTSYAILGQLALRPWTTYELAVEVRRNLHYFWPRAESLIYSEAKRLAALGYASAEVSFTGRRKRTAYVITPTGRSALDAWLATPPRPVLLEFEALLRVLYAPLGPQRDVLQALRQVQIDIDDLLQISGRIAAEYLEGRAPFQRHIQARAFIWDFLTRYAELLRDWSMQAEALISEWGELPIEEQQAQARAFLAARQQRLAAWVSPEAPAE